METAAKTQGRKGVQIRKRNKGTKEHESLNSLSINLITHFPRKPIFFKLITLNSTSAYKQRLKLQC